MRKEEKYKRRGKYKKREKYKKRRKYEKEENLRKEKNARKEENMRKEENIRNQALNCENFLFFVKQYQKSSRILEKNYMDFQNLIKIEFC